VVGITPYELRHTYASLLIHKGTSLLLVAAFMGRSSATVTLDYYAHAFEEARHAKAVPR
jgi:integrase